MVVGYFSSASSITEKSLNSIKPSRTTVRLRLNEIRIFHQLRSVVQWRGLTGGARQGRGSLTPLRFGRPKTTKYGENSYAVLTPPQANSIAPVEASIGETLLPIPHRVPS